MKVLLFISAMVFSGIAIAAPAKKKVTAKAAQVSQPASAKPSEEAPAAPAPALDPAAKYAACQEKLDQLFSVGGSKCSHSMDIRMKNGDNNFVVVNGNDYGEPVTRDDTYGHKMTITRKESGAYTKVDLSYDIQGRLVSLKCGSHDGSPTGPMTNGSTPIEMQFMYDPGTGACQLMEDSGAARTASSSRASAASR